MTTHLLFCTAQIPAATINALLQTSGSQTFSLVRHPDQTASTFDLRGTAPPVATFDSGFAGYSSAQIRAFVGDRIPEPLPGTNLAGGQYALLDEISIGTDTVVFGESYSTLGMHDPDLMTADEIEAWRWEIDEHGQPHDAWREWRVLFRDAGWIIALLNFSADITPKFYNDAFVAQFTDADGIFDFDTARKAYENAPHDEL